MTDNQFHSRTLSSLEILSSRERMVVLLATKMPSELKTSFQVSKSNATVMLEESTLSTNITERDKKELLDIKLGGLEDNKKRPQLIKERCKERLK